VRHNPEYLLQKSVADFLEIAKPNCVWFHCPNGERRDARTGAKLKSMGVKPGVGDLCFVLPYGIAGFIELKSGKGKLTDSQKVFKDDVESLGGLYEEARSIEEVKQILKAWEVL